MRLGDHVLVLNGCGPCTEMDEVRDEEVSPTAEDGGPRYQFTSERDEYQDMPLNRPGALPTAPWKWGGLRAMGHTFPEARPGSYPPSRIMDTRPQWSLGQTAKMQAQSVSQPVVYKSATSSAYIGPGTTVLQPNAKTTELPDKITQEALADLQRLCATAVDRSAGERLQCYMNKLRTQYQTEIGSEADLRLYEMLKDAVRKQASLQVLTDETEAQEGISVEEQDVTDPYGPPDQEDAPSPQLGPMYADQGSGSSLQILQDEEAGVEIPSFSSLPKWVVPVGIGVLVVGGIALALRRR